MSITKLIPCPTCGYPLDETEQKGLATLTERMVLVPRERLEKIAGFWDVTMRATDNDMARLMYDASCIAKGMLSIAEKAE